MRLSTATAAVATVLAVLCWSAVGDALDHGVQQEHFHDEQQRRLILAAHGGEFAHPDGHRDHFDHVHVITEKSTKTNKGEGSQGGHHEQVQASIRKIDEEFLRRHKSSSSGSKSQTQKDLQSEAKKRNEEDLKQRSAPSSGGKSTSTHDLHAHIDKQINDLHGHVDKLTQSKMKESASTLSERKETSEEKSTEDEEKKQREKERIKKIVEDAHANYQQKKLREKEAKIDPKFRETREQILKHVDEHMKKLKSKKDETKKLQTGAVDDFQKNLQNNFQNSDVDKGVQAMEASKQRSRTYDAKKFQKELKIALDDLLPNLKATAPGASPTKILLQRYTLLLHSGRNCYHQSVLAGSNITIYYMAMDREPIQVTILDSNKQLLLQAPDNQTGVMNMKAQYKGMYQVCFTNYRWRERKVFVVFEIEPEDAEIRNPKVRTTMQSTNAMVVNIRRMDALMQYYKARRAISTSAADEYIYLMNRRSWCMLMLALIILALQVYAIHRVFRTAPNGRRAALEKLQYRMAVKV